VRSSDSRSAVGRLASSSTAAWAEQSLTVRTGSDDSPIAVPILIFVVCLLAGVFAASTWLPELASGSVGGLAFFVVCGLSGSALGVAGLRIYGAVEGAAGEPRGSFKNLYMASALTDMLWESGLLLGLAMGVYLLAHRLDAPASSPPPPPGL
jgi:hypothetical protein